jgi:zinc protease
VGGTLEAKSDNQTYHVSIKVLKEDLELALDILADMVRNAQFPQEELEKKRKDVLVAIQRQDESWQAEVLRLFKKGYFKDSPFEHDRLGTAEAVGGYKRDDLFAFQRRMVNPNHSVLAVFGDIDAQAALEGIRRRLGDWKAEPLKLPVYPNETRMIAADRLLEKKNEKVSAALFVGANGLPLASNRRATLDVLDGVLSGASFPGGRLFEALRGKEDLIYAVSAFPFYGVNAGFFGVITQTTMGNLEKVQNIIVSHLRQLMEQPVPAEELELTKDMILTMRRLDNESQDAQAQNAALNEVLGLGWDYEERSNEEIKAVTAQQIQELAKELFGHLLIASTLPEHPVEILAAPTARGAKPVQ